ncbi:MAG: hypothetical protein SVR81_09540 [Chloroflexota bacterium]|nr:hypothetical protein [Chloroflexota bacterium]
MKTAKTQPQSLRRLLIALLILMLASLACTVDLGLSDDGEDIALEQTRVVLQQTQVALENMAQQNQLVEITEESAPIVETEPVDPPQEPDISYEGIRFSFDPSITANVNAATVPGQNMGEDYMPGETYPTYYEFTFSGYAIADHFHTPVIAIYPVDEYRAISPTASDVIDNLQATLASQPAGGNMSNLPFLPIWPAAQIFSAQVAYFDFQNGTGVRYLTMYGQALWPVDNQNLFYTYQGLTDDGRYYISAVLPVMHLGLPDDGLTLVDDWMAFEDNWDSYIAETIAWLNNQYVGNFFPGLDLLDQMMASFEINP